MSESTSTRRHWTLQEVDLLLDVWETNFKKSTTAFPKIINVNECIHKELTLHFDISQKEVKNKIRSLRYRYKKLLANPQLQKQWNLFERIHAFLNGTLVSRNATQTGQNSPQLILNGNCDDESIWIEDSNDEYIGCEQDDINLAVNDTNNSKQNNEKNNIIVNCEPDIFHIESYDATPDALVINKQEIIDLDDNDDKTEFQETTATTNTTFNESNLIQSVQTLVNPSENENFVPSLNFISNSNAVTNHVDTSFPSKVYLCQPYQEKSEADVSAVITVPNSELAQNAQEPPKKRSKQNVSNIDRTSNILLNSEPSPAQIDNNNSTAVLEKLTSLDNRFRYFVGVKENLSRQMYRESLQHTVLLTRILEETQRQTQLMERLVKRPSI